MNDSQFETVTVGNIRIHIYSSNKFKTTSLVAFIQQNLCSEFVTKNALLPNVLQRGTLSYPSTIDLKRKCDEMYGTTLFADVFKRGEHHILQFGMEMANEQFLKNNPPILREGLSFFTEVLIKPVLEHGVFRNDYVEAEKKILKQKIESLKDDKIRYAIKRMIEEMCKNEPFSLFNNGQLEDLPQIDAKNLYSYYQTVMQTCPIDIYFVGNVSTEEIIEYFKDFIQQLNPNQKRKEILPVSIMDEKVKEIKEVIDCLDVKQGKLNMGCRTHVSIDDDEYTTLLMYNGILGGFPHSKLFVNVREKASLAYYASSRIESYKGLLIIQSGIEIDHYDRAVQIIKEQIEAIRQGEISDKEIEQTKATLCNQLKEQQDKPFELIHFHYHSILCRKKQELSDYLEQIQQVKKEDVQKVGEKVELDTIYFLRDKGE